VAKEDALQPIQFLLQ